MLIDDIKIRISAGHGGKGAVAFNKNLMSLGPAGGSGGKGGSVIFHGIEDMGALRHFRYKKDFDAENGEDGRFQFVDGSDGEDLVLKVPVGTVIHNLDLGTETEISKIGEEVVIAKGGKGGKGNFHFRSSTNTSPTQFQPGLPGEAFELRLELKLIADVGFVGFPNVGKSSLLNELTAAKSKVANYAFTTLEPHLGAYYGLILADIPGIIEGASEGKGLGVKFLRHIERTGVLFHFVSAEAEDPVSDYKVIRAELKSFNPKLLKKKEFLFLSKSDAIPEKEVKAKLVKLKKLNKNAMPLSIIDEEAMGKVRKILDGLIAEKTAPAVSKNKKVSKK